MLRCLATGAGRGYRVALDKGVNNWRGDIMAAHRVYKAYLMGVSSNARHSRGKPRELNVVKRVKADSGKPHRSFFAWRIKCAKQTILRLKENL